MTFAGVAMLAAAVHDAAESDEVVAWIDCQTAAAAAAAAAAKEELEPHATVECAVDPRPCAVVKFKRFMRDYFPRTVTDMEYMQVNK